MKFFAILPITLSLAAVPAFVTAETTDLSGLSQTYELAQNRDYTDVVRGLEAVDYQIEGISTTLLGRTRIMANNGDHRREVIVSRTTGEVLSDLIVDVQPDADAVARQSMLDAASEPKSDDGGSGIAFGGSFSIGINNKTGGSGRGMLTAEKDNIGGTGINGSFSIGSDF